MENDTILVINSGSSSIKYKLMNPETGEEIARGIVEQIGEDRSRIKHVYQDVEEKMVRSVRDHLEGMAIVEELFEKIGPPLEESHVVGVGHRIVQGGPYFSGPAVIDKDVYALIEELCPLGPLHNPAHLKGIDAAKRILPKVPHVAVFDTAFFNHLPEKAYTYALKRSVAEKFRIRRYGAHGTSHQYVSQRVRSILGTDDLRQIVLHLGNGASASAIVRHHPIDTSMGLTPLEGLVMGGRTGDIDPAAVFHLYREAEMSIDEIDELFNRRSGMKGLTGHNDMREIWKLIEAGDEQAEMAMEIYLHRLLKYVGAYWALLGGLDVLTFTAGVGENDPGVRWELCRSLAFMGVKIDQELNEEHFTREAIISTPDSAVKVLVVPTNEELAIAQQAYSLVKI
ncbi:acetate/propionate family kinase [uncultured Varibaculum sp.]|uniref:acetate/propionate family kinase n=1 Tax=uncultured Varibaculum sp. TaxID=413896 RepID=UPI00258896E4|nr:acetate kinase [uncultured Varibaculum sp.]